METNKDRIIEQIHQMGFIISKNIEQNRLDSWLFLNLTMSQLKGLVYITFQENVCIRDLSQTLKMAQPNVTNLVDFLVKEGLVSREENPEDRRMLMLKTTAKGKKLVAELTENILNEMSRYLMQLSMEQLQALENGLKPLAKLVQEGHNQIAINKQ